jgi:hypothetical protein
VVAHQCLLCKNHLEKGCGNFSTPCQPAKEEVRAVTLINRDSTGIDTIAGSCCRHSTLTMHTIVCVGFACGKVKMMSKGRVRLCIASPPNVDPQAKFDYFLTTTKDNNIEAFLAFSRTTHRQLMNGGQGRGAASSSRVEREESDDGCQGCTWRQEGIESEGEMDHFLALLGFLLR